MDIPWDDVRLFVAVADAGSMSGAARQLRLGQATISRRLAALEEQLGHLLFDRSAGGVTLTRDGEHLLEPARRMAEWASEVQDRARRSEGGPSGTVRLAAPPGVAFDFVAPVAARIRRELPNVILEVLSGVRYVDLVRREADLALRFRSDEQRDTVTVASVEFGVGAFASLEYASRLPKGYTVADIDWLGWAPPLQHMTPNPELARMVPGWRPAFAVDDFIVMWRAAEEGLGAIFLGKLVHASSRLDQLVELDLKLGRLPPGSLHLVGARRALDIPRIRAVADIVVDELHAATR